MLKVSDEIRSRAVLGPRRGIFDPVLFSNHFRQVVKVDRTQNKTGSEMELQTYTVKLSVTMLIQ